MTAACHQQAQTQTSTKPVAAPPEYFPTATVNDLMQSVVDPAAVVWLSVTSVQDSKGTHDKAPMTDEEWTQVVTARSH